MLGSFVQWLDRVGPLVFWTCTIAIVTLDTAAVAAVIGTRSRELVNRWTGTVLAVNFLLVGAGVGVPAAMWATKMAVQTFAPSAMISITNDVELRER